MKKKKEPIPPKNQQKAQYKAENPFFSMRKLQQTAIAIVEHAEPNISLTSFFGAFGYPLYYLVWTYLYPQPYENLALRMFCSIVCLPWALYTELPRRLKEHFPLYYFLSLFIVMPYFFSFMLLKNEWSQVWAMSFMASTFLVTIFIFDWILICIMTGLGFIAAYLTVYLLDGKVSFAYFVPEYIPSFMFAIFGGILVNHKRELANQSKILLMRCLSGYIAHEMRNPLSSITNAMNTVQAIIPNKPDTGKKQSSFNLTYSALMNIHTVIDESLATIKRGNKIIDSLLASLQDGNLDITNFKRLSAKNTIHSAIVNYGYSDVNERKLVIQSRSSVTFDFFGDKDLFMYVLFNLIKNALHYKDIPGFRIEIATEKNGTFNCIRVRDNGPGIPAGEREKIFDRFYTYGKSGGNGLGLSFCRRIVESFGGTITCDSQEGHWTEFIIKLPAYGSKTVTDLKRTILRNKKILVVDDQPSNRLTLGKHITEWGCGFEQAENGKQAIETLSKTRFDLIFMDFEMPDLNGDQTVRHLRSVQDIDPGLAAHYLQVPIIGTTALAPTEALRRAAICGMNEVLCKPIGRLDVGKTFERYFFSETRVSPLRHDEAQLAGKKILLVDDNNTSRHFMSMILKHYHCQIGQAENGQIAIKQLEEQDYDVILMDMEMPVMNGIETSKAIREGRCFKRFRNFSAIPIIALTGNTDQQNIESAKKAGMNHFLSKPVFRDELVAVISGWVKNPSVQATECRHV